MALGRPITDKGALQLQHQYMNSCVLVDLCQFVITFYVMLLVVVKWEISLPGGANM